jgi:hypothetical protein
MTTEPKNLWELYNTPTTEPIHHESKRERERPEAGTWRWNGKDEENGEWEEILINGNRVA